MKNAWRKYDKFIGELTNYLYKEMEILMYIKNYEAAIQWYNQLDLCSDFGRKRVRPISRSTFCRTKPADL
mgnify:CR=1 FL=1